MNIKKDKFFKNYGYAAIVWGVTFLGTILISYLVVKPLYTNVQKSGDELAVMQDEYKNLTDKKNMLDKLKDKEAELKEQATVVSNALPREEEIGRLFIQLDSLAKASNGILNSVTRVSDGSANTTSEGLINAGITKNVYSLPLELPTYFDLKTFISNSDSALRLFSINNFDITASEAGALTIRLTANSYTRN